MSQLNLDHLAAASRLLALDYPVRPRSRCTFDEVPKGPLAERIASGYATYQSALEQFVTLLPGLAGIPATGTDPRQPHWLNDWIPAFDAISLYGFVALRNPAIYLEIGSGTSTKFVRKAISDYALRTKIVSIDPNPRSEIDPLCDLIIRKPLENTDLRCFDLLKEGDVVFCDGSHRTFQNSDATVFLTEVVPKLGPQILVGIHDIFLPWDYPPDWATRYYSEQYLLTCYLLGGDALKPELSTIYCTKTEALLGILNPIWELPELAQANKGGALLWFTPQRPAIN